MTDNLVDLQDRLQAKAANEIDGGKCPVLGNVMMPDYKVCRDQSRAIK